MCLTVPVLYIRVFSLILGLTQLTISDIMTQNLLLWKSIAVNIFLAATLTLKMAAFTPSITTLDYFLGIGLYSFFSANFNTEDKALDYAKECKSQIEKFTDIFELADCQKVVIPAYLYAIAALCVALAVIHLFLISVVSLWRVMLHCCCQKDRPNDRQVRRMQAER